MIHNRKEATKTAVLRRVLIYGILFFLLSVLQCSFFAYLSPFGAIPNLTLGALCGIILLDRRESALICAIASGFLLDALGASGLALSPVIFFVIAVIGSAVAKKMLPNFLSWSVILAGGALLGALSTLLRIAQMSDGVAFTLLLRTVLLPELLGTILFSLPLYPLLRFCVSRADAKGHFRM